MKLILTVLFAAICAPAFADTVVANCEGYVLKSDSTNKSFTINHGNDSTPMIKYACSLGDPLMDVECYRGGVENGILDIVREITWNTKHTKVIRDEMHGLLNIGTGLRSLNCKQY